MIYELNGKNIRIPDAEINKNMKLLNISKDEAIQMWLEDNEYLENAEVEALTAKAKENKISHEAKANKPRKVTQKERKPDEEKENLIEILANALKDAGFDAKIVNKTKIIEFNIGETGFTVDLIRHNKKKS